MSSIGSSLLAQMNSPCTSPSQASIALTQSETATSWNLWFGGQRLTTWLSSAGAALSVTVSSAEQTSSSPALTTIVCVPGANGPESETVNVAPSHADSSLSTTY